jgi:hypothetical protein
VWLANVKKEYKENLQIDWRPFFLAQINNKEGDDWKAWEQTEDNAQLGIFAFRTAEAARRQGSERFEAFQLALLKARHEDRKDLSNQEVVMEAAQAGGLDMGQLKEDMADDSIIKDLGDSHTEAVDVHGAFGVPTFVFSNGSAAFLKTYIPPEEESVSTFETLNGVMSGLKYVGELKRPQPPWPKGVFD